MRNDEILVIELFINFHSLLSFIVIIVIIIITSSFATGIGGIPTLISSPPNMIFVEQFEQRFGGREGVPTLSFSNWLIATLTSMNSE